MKRVAAPSAHRTRFNMTPLVDVVFLLMIFFMATAQLHTEAQPADVELPAAATAEAPATVPLRLTINVLAPNRVVVRNRQRSYEELDKLIGAFAGQAEGRPVEVKVRSDRQVAWGLVQPILAICAEHGIWNVTFGVERKPGRRGPE